MLINFRRSNSGILLSRASFKTRSSKLTQLNSRFRKYSGFLYGAISIFLRLLLHLPFQFDDRLYAEYLIEEI